VFLSYRREDSAAYAGRLFDDLTDQFGGDAVFMDIDTIAVGSDFVEVIEQAVAACDVMLTLIGPRWLTVTDREGRRRLDNESDFVRLEVATGLARGRRMIPILVGDADMPSPADLPPDLAPLTRRHAFELSDRRWRADVAELASALTGTGRPTTWPIGANATEQVSEVAPLGTAPGTTVPVIESAVLDAPIGAQAAGLHQPPPPSAPARDEPDEAPSPSERVEPEMATVSPEAAQSASPPADPSRERGSRSSPWRRIPIWGYAAAVVVVAGGAATGLLLSGSNHPKSLDPITLAWGTTTPCEAVPATVVRNVIGSNSWITENFAPLSGDTVVTAPDGSLICQWGVRDSHGAFVGAVSLVLGTGASEQAIGGTGVAGVGSKAFYSLYEDFGTNYELNVAFGSKGIQLVYIAFSPCKASQRCAQIPLSEQLQVLKSLAQAVIARNGGSSS
jgi:hypothetical protein